MSRFPHIAFGLLVSTGCRQVLGFEELGGIDANGPDTSSDGPQGDGAVESLCFGTEAIRPCFESVPTDDLLLNAGFDTDAACPKSATLDGRPMCVLGARTISVQSTVRITGSLPVVLVATDSLTVAIDATLDLSSSAVNNRQGAGSPGTACANSPAGGTFGGAAGGTFGARGGNGGSGSGEAGGVAPGVQVVSFDGGCPGGALVQSFAGRGGGAVYLLAPSITINGTILATGGGGRGGLMGSGGAGGGSGGSIAIEAGALVLGGQARLVATGGGGGSGSCSASPGVAGDDADSDVLAFGGPGPGNAGDGGDGGFQLVQAGAGDPGAKQCGGGGGGGGAGTIQFFHGNTCTNTQCFPPVVSTP